MSSASVNRLRHQLRNVPVVAPFRYIYRWLNMPQSLARIEQLQIQSLNRPNSVYLGDYRALLRTSSGHLMYVDTRDSGPGAQLLMNGTWEPAIASLFQRLIKPGMNVLEVGANLGFHTLLAAQQCGSEGHIWAFEGHPGTHQLLKRNIYTNGYFLFAETVPKLAHDHIGEVEFNICEGLPGSSSIGTFDDASQTRMEELGVQTRTISVPTTTVDAELPPDVKIDVVKIDAEGSEPFVLAGMDGIIKRNPDIVMIVEFYPRNFNMTQTDPAAFLEKLQSYGFILRHIEHSGAVSPISAKELLERRSSELFLSRHQNWKAKHLS